MCRLGWKFQIVLCMLALAFGANAQPVETPRYIGQAVASVIDAFRVDGWSFVYSTHLVSETMLVITEPQGDDPIRIVREILQPYKLAVREQDEFFLIVRMTEAEIQAQAPLVELGAPADPTRPVLETITVSASRYHLSRELANSLFYIDQRTIQNMPDIGEDPVRIAQRLPGTAAGGFSAKTHFRGGEEGETGIILNGHRLFDPFHVRRQSARLAHVRGRRVG